MQLTYLLTYLGKAKFIAGPHTPVAGKQTAFWLMGLW